MPVIEQATILSAERLNARQDTHRLTLHSPQIAAKCKPGQFVMIKCPSPATLRRPISVCNFDARAGTLTLCVDVRGRGTGWICARQAGERLDLMGPSGHGFTVLDPEARVLLAGGGIGVYPLYSIGKCYKHVSAVFGFRSAELVTMRAEFAALCGEDLHISTDDGSLGFHGYAPALLQHVLGGGGRFDMLYVCGPWPMLRACVQIAQDRGLRCEVSMEQRMGCGIGACLSCVCATKLLNSDSTEYKRVCVDGPVFPAEMIKTN